MTTFGSPVESIRKLRVHTVPTSGINAKKAVRIGKTVLILGNNGKLYSNDSRNACYMLGSEGWVTNVIRAAHRLGFVSKEELESHLKANKEAAKKRNRKEAATMLRHYAKELGVPLTQEQLNIVNRKI